MVFDEIDVGISGVAAERVGEKMAELGRSHQVICITHLPQIAAKGFAHFAVVKQTKSQKTTIAVRRLAPEGRLAELARLMSGAEVSQSGLRYASELLRDSN